MSIKVVTISYEKGGTLARQTEQLEKAKSDLEALLQSADKIVSVIKLDTSELGQFVTIVDIADKEKHKEEKHHDSHKSSHVSSKTEDK